MNLDKFSQKEAVEKLIQNKEEFFDVINQSNGFILEIVSNYKLKPDLNMMLENLNVFTIQFIVDQYKLDTEQNLKIANFLSDESPMHVHKTLTTDEVEEYLKSNKVLPPTVIFSVAEINKFHKEISKQVNLDDNEIHPILKNSFRKFTMEDIFSLNKEFLFNEDHLLRTKTAFFQDKKYREFYKDIIFSKYENPTLNYFGKYVFTPEDKELLTTLLNNENSKGFWRKKYDEYSGITGFTSLMDKYEYFEKYNSDDLSSFSDGEVENNPGFFKKCILANNENRRTYESFAEFLRNKATLPQFRAIFDEEFVDKYMSELSTLDRGISRFFGSQEAEYDNSIIDKKAHVSQILSKFFAEDKVLENGVKFNDIVPFHSVSELLSELVKEKYSPVDKEQTQKDIEQIAQNLQTGFSVVLPTHLKTENFSELASYSRYVFSPEVISLADQFCAENKNINNFFVLINLYNDNANRSKRFYNSNKNEFMNTLNDYIKRMHSDIIKNNNHNDLVGVNMILKSYPQLKEDFKGLIKKTPSRQGFISSDEYNFFAYEVNDLSKLPSDMWSVVYDIRPEFSDYILKNNIVAPTNLLNSCLNAANNEDAKAIDFLKGYVKLHREEIDKDEKLVASFLGNSKQSEIYPLSSTAHLEIYYNEILVLLQRKDVASEKMSQLKAMHPRQEFPYSREDGKYPQVDIGAFDENTEVPAKLPLYDAMSLYLNFYEKDSALSKELNAKAQVLPYSFMTEKIEGLIKAQNFAGVVEHKDHRLKYNVDPFRNYVANIGFNQFMENLNDKNFNTLLKGQLNYNDEPSVMFPSFSYKENMKLSVKLLEAFNEMRYSDSTHRNDHSFLRFFKQEDRAFIKEFAINYLPRTIFYTYDFLPEGTATYKPSNFIQGTYSNEEIYQAFLNVEKQGGFFSEKDVNADFKHFFSDVFFPERRSNNVPKDDSRFKEFLEFAKEKDEMLYTIMSNQNIFINVIDWGRNRRDENSQPEFKTRDEAINNYFHKIFDFDLVLKGLDKVIQNMTKENRDQDGQDIINRKVAGHVITGVVHNTYFEDYDDQGRTREYKSVTSKEDTLKLMKFLFEKAPMHFVERHIFGQATDPVAYFTNNIKEFYDFEKIKNFILPNADISNEYFNLGGDKNEQRDRVLGFTRAIIEHAVENHDSKMIDFLNHTIKQHEFIQKEMKWDHRSSVYKGIDEGIIHAISNDKTLKGLLQNAKLKMDLDLNLVVKEPAVRKTKKI